MKRTIYVGPPGTGKTHKLLDILAEELKTIAPNRVAFCSFTNKAVDEAKHRACERFKFTNDDLPFFRTAHSLGMKLIGAKPGEIMQRADYQKICEHLGIEFTTTFVDMADIHSDEFNKFKVFMSVIGLAKAKQVSTKDIWNSCDRFNISYAEFARFEWVLDDYKQTRNKIDFADMIGTYTEPLDIDVAIIDEAQDLTSSQWDFVERVFSTAKRIYIAGDDDQAIYEWSGADVNRFIYAKGEKHILSQSHRVPKLIHGYANDIAHRISNRSKKEYNPRDIEGSLAYWWDMSHIDMSQGTWLVLTRNTFQIKHLAEEVKSKGFMYNVKGESCIDKDHIKAIKLWEKWRAGGIITVTDMGRINEYLPKNVTVDKTKIWHEAFTNMSVEDREYYISLLRSGESLTKQSRININTIHGVKGGEADHVILNLGMTKRTWEAQQWNPDAEHRVWYVGATRCRESLHIVSKSNTQTYVYEW